MKKIAVFFTGAMLLVALFAATAFKPVTTGGSANGQGTLSLPGDITRHFAFHANSMPNGSVKGNGELTYTAGGAKIKFDINCLSISGNTATMSGVITSFPDLPTAEGANCWFRVEDNGEGSNATADRITLLVAYTNGGGATCYQNAGAALIAIDGGNIQVKP